MAEELENSIDNGSNKYTAELWGEIGTLRRKNLALIKERNILKHKVKVLRENIVTLQKKVDKFTPSYEVKRAWFD